MPERADHREVLLVTKGHPFDRAAFFTIFDDMEGVGWTHVEQPAAQALFSVEAASPFDAFVLYDMPGIVFHAHGPPEFPVPHRAYQERFLALLEAGHGFVFLHHAIAGWPAWDTYADIVGGRFLYLPGPLRGKERQDSGYRHDVTHEIRVVAEHPVTAGVPERFTLTDELYLYEVFENDVQPLLVSGHEFVQENFYSAARVVRERRMFSNEGWQHEPGSNLIGWAKTWGNSRIVYLQCGDGPVAYADENFRRLIRNAVYWVSDR